MVVRLTNQTAELLKVYVPVTVRIAIFKQLPALVSCDGGADFEKQSEKLILRKFLKLLVFPKYPYQVNVFAGDLELDVGEDFLNVPTHLPFLPHLPTILVLHDLVLKQFSPIHSTFLVHC